AQGTKVKWGNECESARSRLPCDNQKSDETLTLHKKLNCGIAGSACGILEFLAVNPCSVMRRVFLAVVRTCAPNPQLQGSADPVRIRPEDDARLG
ncbi:MAG: hypothetical protein ACLQGP_11385, partial [Isosphaeraceae bacterium]